MTSKTIDTLGAASALASGDKFPLAASGSDTLTRATVSQLQTYMQANLTFGGGVEVLTADRTYYVRTDGSDSNTGLANTAGGAFLTIQKACDVASAIVTAGYTLTISIGDGAYGEEVFCRFPLATLPVVIVGNTTTPGNVTLLSITVFAGSVDVSGVDCSNYLAAYYGAYLSSHQCNSASYQAYYSGSHDVVDCAAYGIGVAFSAASNAFVGLYSTITIVGTPAYASQCAYATGGGVIESSATFSGSATGQRYLAELNGVINTFGSGATYFPGSVAGVEATGGRYA